GLDLLERSRRLVAIEVAVEVDLVADDAHMAVTLVPLAGVDPRVGDVGPDLAVEELADARRNAVLVDGVVTDRKRDTLRVSQLGVGLRVAVGITADGCRLVALGQSGEDRLPEGRGQAELRGFGRSAEGLEELIAILVDGVGERPEEFPNGFLLRRAGFTLPVPGLAGTPGSDEGPETAFCLQAFDALGARLEVEAERALDGDLAVSEVSGREDLTDHDLLGRPVFLHDPGLAILEGREDVQDLAGAVGGDLAALVAEAPPHGDPEGGSVDQLHETPAARLLAVRHHPDVGGDAGVVEELLRQ